MSKEQKQPQKATEENPFRTVLEDIVLEAQNRTNAVKFKLDDFKKGRDYEDTQIQIYTEVFNYAQGMFEYIANKYGNLVEKKD